VDEFISVEMNLWLSRLFRCDSVGAHTAQSSCDFQLYWSQNLLFIAVSRRRLLNLISFVVRDK